MTMNWGAERCLQSAEVAKEDDRFEEKTYTLGVKDNQRMVFRRPEKAYALLQWGKI